MLSLVVNITTEKYDDDDDEEDDDDDDDDECLVVKKTLFAVKQIPYTNMGKRDMSCHMGWKNYMITD